MYIFVLILQTLPCSMSYAHATIDCTPEVNNTRSFVSYTHNDNFSHSFITYVFSKNLPSCLARLKLHKEAEAIIVSTESSFGILVSDIVHVKQPENPLNYSLPVNNSLPISIHVPTNALLPHTYTLFGKELQCHWFDASNHHWSNEGCSRDTSFLPCMLNQETGVRCTCDKIGEFALLLRLVPRAGDGCLIFPVIVGGIFAAFHILVFFYCLIYLIRFCIHNKVWIQRITPKTLFPLIVCLHLGILMHSIFRSLVAIGWQISSDTLFWIGWVGQIPLLLGVHFFVVFSWVNTHLPLVNMERSCTALITFILLVSATSLPIIWIHVLEPQIKKYPYLNKEVSFFAISQVPVFGAIALCFIAFGLHLIFMIRKKKIKISRIKWAKVIIGSIFFFLVYGFFALDSLVTFTKNVSEYQYALIRIGTLTFNSLSVILPLFFFRKMENDIPIRGKITCCCYNMKKKKTSHHHKGNKKHKNNFEGTIELEHKSSRSPSKMSAKRSNRSTRKSAMDRSSSMVRSPSMARSPSLVRSPNSVKSPNRVRDSSMMASKRPRHPSANSSPHIYV